MVATYYPRPPGAAAEAAAAAAAAATSAAAAAAAKAEAAVARARTRPGARTPRKPAAAPRVKPFKGLSTESTRGDLAVFMTNHGGQPRIVDFVLGAGTSGAKKAAPQTREDIIKQLKQMEGAKFRRYGDWPIPDGNLIPFAIHVHGAIGDKGLELLGNIASYESLENSLLSYQSTVELRKQNSITRISVALQQANAATYYQWRASHLRAAAAAAEEEHAGARAGAEEDGDEDAGEIADEGAEGGVGESADEDADAEADVDE